MKIIYFDPLPADSASAARAWKLLMLHYHPDRNPDPNATAETQAINNEYAYILSNQAFSQARARQDAAHAENRRTNADYIDLENVTELLREKISEILAANLEGIEIEICGLWLWIHGNTRPHAATLKALKLRWAPIKQSWYYAATPASSSHGKMSMDDIRNHHGSQRVKTTAADDDQPDNPTM